MHVKPAANKDDKEGYFELSDQEVQELLFEIFNLLAEQFDGDTTLNSLRIGNYIGLKSLYYGVATNNKDIAATLNISPSTVSRLVTNLMQLGYVGEESHPSDGRIRLVSIAEGHPLIQAFESSVKRALGHGFRLQKKAAD